MKKTPTGAVEAIIARRMVAMGHFRTNARFRNEDAVGSTILRLAYSSYNGVGSTLPKAMAGAPHAHIPVPVSGVAEK